MKRLIIKIKRNIVDKITNIDTPFINFLENFDRLIHLFLAIVIVLELVSDLMFFYIFPLTNLYFCFIVLP